MAQAGAGVGAGAGAGGPVQAQAAVRPLRAFMAAIARSITKVMECKRPYRDRSCRPLALGRKITNARAVCGPSGQSGRWPDRIADSQQP